MFLNFVSVLFCFFCLWNRGYFWSCKDHFGGLKCCKNDQEKGDLCVPCELGTSRVSCSIGPCPSGYFGFRCAYRCYCSTDQYCDRRAGCVYTTTNETVLTNGTGVCKDAFGTLKCCTDFQQKDGFCKPCEVGTYGDNCSGGPCPYGSYGLRCRSKCNCTADQYCDRRSGCEYNNTRGKEAETSGTDGMDPIAETLFVVLGVFLGVGLILTVLFVYKRLKYQRGSRYSVSMFSQPVYDYTIHERGAELNVKHYVNDTVPNIEGSGRNPVANKQDNDYVEII